MDRRGLIKEGNMRADKKLVEPGLLVLLILLVGGMLAVLASAGCQAEPDMPSPEPPDGQPNGSRLLERQVPASVKQGDEVEIIVVFHAERDGFHAIGLTEQAPDGWVVSVDAAWTDPEADLAHNPESGQAVYVWEGPYDAGAEFTAKYKVTVPADTPPGTYTFSGSLRYYIEPHPASPYEEDIAGDAEVTVSS